MRVFVAGATGAIGKQLLPQLVGAGHEVHGMTRHESKQMMLDELGAVPVVADVLDPDQVARAVGKAQPDVIVHQVTALAGKGVRSLKRGAALTNRLRSEGTDHLLSAGQHDTLGPPRIHDRLLEVSERGQAIAQPARRRGIEQVLLGLHRPAGAGVYGEVALRHEPPHPHSLGFGPVFGSNARQSVTGHRYLRWSRRRHHLASHLQPTLAPARPACTHRRRMGSSDALVWLGTRRW